MSGGSKSHRKRPLREQIDTTVLQQPTRNQRGSVRVQSNTSALDKTEAVLKEVAALCKTFQDEARVRELARTLRSNFGAERNTLLATLDLQGCALTRLPDSISTLEAVRKLLTRSTRFTHVCTAQISKFQQNSSEILAKMKLISFHSGRKSLNFVIFQ